MSPAFAGNPTPIDVLAEVDPKYDSGVGTEAEQEPLPDTTPATADAWGDGSFAVLSASSAEPTGVLTALGYATAAGSGRAGYKLWVSVDEGENVRQTVILSGYTSEFGGLSWWPPLPPGQNNYSFTHESGDGEDFLVQSGVSATEGESASSFVLLSMGVVSSFQRGSAPGDIDEDGDVDQIDVTLLQDAIAGNSIPDDIHDLNSDTLVDEDDFDYMINDILETVQGDINLDGSVNISDYSLLAPSLGKASVWGLPSEFSGLSGAPAGSGDFNRDGFTNLGDYAYMAANWGYPNNFHRPLVPEPIGIAPLMFGCLGRRRRLPRSDSTASR